MVYQLMPFLMTLSNFQGSALIAIFRTVVQHMTRF